jgi:hypothetical protein
MVGQSSSYTSDLNNNNIQKDFESNLQTQLDSIKKIQDQQTELYSKLEVLGASKNISDENIQKQINDIFKQIDTLNKVNELNQTQLNASRYAYADSITALKIIEENLTNKQKILNDALAIRDNSERMVGVNTYYTRRYEEHSNVLKYVVLFCGIIILSIFLMKIGIINNTISSIIIIISFVLGIIIVGRKVWDLSRRSNINYDQYSFKFDPKGAPKDTKIVTNVNTDMTYGGEIFGNICNAISKGASDIKKDIQTSAGYYDGASATDTSTSNNVGTGGAGSVDTFIVKNYKNKFDEKAYGCPLASNDTSYSYTDYEEY